MAERTVSLAELVEENQIEVGAGRPRSVNQDQGPLPILRVADVLDGKIGSLDFSSSPESHSRDLGPKVSRPGDIVLTVKGTVGRVALMPSDGPRFAYSPQLCYFRPCAAGPLVARYLYYWFKSADFWIQANALKGQTDMADFISLGDILSLKLRLPSRVQQEDVIGVLGALDDKITVNERVAHAAENLCRAVFSENSWEARTTVGEIAALHKGQARPETLTEASVAHYSLPAFDSGAMPEIADPRTIKSAKFIVRQPSVLLSKLNPEIPRVWNVAPDRTMPALASTEFLVLEPQSGVTTAELWAVLSRPELLGGLAAKVTGTSKSHQRVRPAEVMNSTVVDPRELGHARRQAQALVSRAMQARSESRRLAALRDTLLPQLMSGKLQIREAEKIVEDAV